MPTVHTVAYRLKRALREGQREQIEHMPTGTILVADTVSLPTAEPALAARRLSMSFIDPRTRQPLTLDAARALSWLELIHGEDRRCAFVECVGQHEGRKAFSVWNFYVCYGKDNRAFMPAYTEDMGKAGLIPYITLEPNFTAAREAMRELKR